MRTFDHRYELNTIVCLTLVAVAGCGSNDKSNPIPLDERRVLTPYRPLDARDPNAGPPIDGPGDGAAAAPTPRPMAQPHGWTIIIAAYRADERSLEPEPAAAAALEKVRTQGGLPAAELERRGKADVIRFGDFSSPGDENAKAALAMVRGFRSGNSYPFAEAYLAPPPGETMLGSMPDFDLRNARRLFGPKRAAYTLQIAVYGRDDRGAPTSSQLQEFRATAERAVADLRKEGEKAFYFHGPNSSSVTLGLFTAEDIDAKKPGGESAVLRAARSVHPNNLLNGQGLNERVPGVLKDGKPVFRLQPSAVVEVPQ